MENIIDISVEKCAMRLLNENDLELILNWRNHVGVRHNMFNSHEISLEEHQLWFIKASKDLNKHLLIFEIDKTAQGVVNFNVSVGNIADWGFYINPHAKKGTGYWLGKTVLKYAFEFLKFHKICGKVLEFNHKSIKFHYNLGFDHEGTLIEQHFDGKQYHSVKCFGFLNKNWLASSHKDTN